MMFRSILVLCVVSLGAAFFGTAKADDNKPFDDATFVAMTASCGIQEVELGKLGVKQAQREDVKRFAQKMIDEHTAANDSLKKVATSAGWTMPDKMNETHQKEFDKIKDLKGEAFDTAYIKLMVEDHEKAVKHFTRASKEAKNSALRDFAANTLPTLEGHLEQIKKIRDNK